MLEMTANVSPKMMTKMTIKVKVRAVVEVIIPAIIRKLQTVKELEANSIRKRLVTLSAMKR